MVTYLYLNWDVTQFKTGLMQSSMDLNNKIGNYFILCVFFPTNGF